MDCEKRDEEQGEDLVYAPLLKGFQAAARALAIDFRGDSLWCDAAHEQKH